VKNLQSLLRLDFLPTSVDLGLLTLRLWLGLTMLALHGWDKLSKFQSLAGGFADPLGIGRKASLGLVVFAEVACSLLIIFGLFTRLGALVCSISMGVAFFAVHKMSLKSMGNGEMAFLYLAGYVTIFLAGPGRFAWDGNGAGARVKK
jgi:putative oxidoreductase